MTMMAGFRPLMLVRATLLVLAAWQALAESAPQFHRGDVVATALTESCNTHPGGGFGAAILRRGAPRPEFLSINGYGHPTTPGPLTYSAALNQMVMLTNATLEILDADGGYLTRLFTLPEQGKINAIAGIGPDVLAIVTLWSPLYRVELWRIAAVDAAVKERIELMPLLANQRDITSFDLAADRCTLAYVIYGEPVRRYDICRRQPLPALSARRATAVHFVPGGDLIAAECRYEVGEPPWFNQLTRYDRQGRVVSATMLDLRALESVNGIALDPDGASAWIVIGPFNCITTQAQRTMAIDLSTGEITAGPWEYGNMGIAVAGQWRAAEQTPPRRRVAR